MKYKIVKKSEYEHLKKMKKAQTDLIIILDAQLNAKTAENVRLQLQIAEAREEIRKRISS